MAKRNRTSFQKRNRERRKAEKAAWKRERRDLRKNPSSETDTHDVVSDEDIPMTEQTADDQRSTEEPVDERLNRPE